MNDNSNKQNDFSKVVDVDDWAANSNNAMKKSTTTTTTTHDDDMAMKNREKLARRTAAAAKTTTTTADDDAQIKRRAKAATSGGGTAVGSKSVGGLEALDRDIEAKNQARRTMTMGVGIAPAKLTTTGSIKKNPQEVDTDTAIKNRARGAGDSGPATKPGVFFNNNHNNINQDDSEDDDDDDGLLSSKKKEVDVDTMIKRRAMAGGPTGSGSVPRSNLHKFGDEDDDDDDDVGAGWENETNDLLKKKEKTTTTTVVTSYNNAGSPGTVKQVTNGGGGGDLEQGKLEKTDTAATLQTNFGGEGFNDENLAVAKLVNEDDDDGGDHDKVFKTSDGIEYEPGHATEYDPDAKPQDPKLKSFLSTWKGKAVLALGLLVVAAVIIVPVMLTVGSKNDDDSIVSGPTMSPTTYREGLGIQEQIEQLIGSAKLEIEGSPERRAMEWILFDDPMQLTGDSENLQQRYILTLIYLKTIADGPWRSCNPPMANETADCTFKKLVRDVPLTFEDIPATRWLSERSECEWVGITCFAGKVTEVWLTATKMSGPFPEEFALLPWLYQLFLVYQDLSGPFPMKLLEMKSLDHLALNNLNLTGTIPPELFALENMRKIQVIGNYFTGPFVIPTPFNLHSCTDLQLFSNQITGTIPTEFGLISNLQITRLSKNPYLTGPIPTQIGQLTNIETAWFHRTALSGTIPSQVGGMSALRDFRVFSTDIGGTIPEEMYNVETLETWKLQDTNITGTISTNIGKLTNLKGFQAKSTQLTGPIPSELGKLTNLEWLWLQNNQVTGRIPEGICGLRNNSRMYQLSADCLPPEHLLFPKVECSCCIECCVSGDDGEAYCEEQIDSTI